MAECFPEKSRLYVLEQVHSAVLRTGYWLLNKNLTVNRIQDTFPYPLDSPMELLVSSQHRRQRLTAGYLVVMWFCCWLSHDSNSMNVVGRLYLRSRLIAGRLSLILNASLIFLRQKLFSLARADASWVMVLWPSFTVCFPTAPCFCW